MKLSTPVISDQLAELLDRRPELADVGVAAQMWALGVAAA